MNAITSEEATLVYACRVTSGGFERGGEKHPLQGIQ